jgi:class 3 adenylate cyclase
MNVETQFARTSDGTHVAYQVSGSGPVDIVLLRAWYTSIEHEWDEPVLARVMRRIGAMGRLIRLDRRGTGLSDRIAIPSSPCIEDRLDDLRAVMQAAGSDGAILVGLADAAKLCTVFAATYPELCRGLVLYESPPIAGERPLPMPDGAGGDKYFESIRKDWGTRALAERIAANGAPSRVGDARLIDWLLEDFHRSGSADDAVALLRVSNETTVAGVLPAVHVPTLVTARTGSMADAATSLAAAIPGAQLALLPGSDHMLLAGDTDAFLRELERFVGEVSGAPAESDERVLATLLFTDIVASTPLAISLGDRAWSTLLEKHHASVRRLIAGHRGREVDTAGDGVFATFDGPGRAIRCTIAIAAAAHEHGIEIRAGLHTGEVERAGDRLRGIAVHIAARVAATASPLEVLVTGTVRDLVAGSGIEFDDRGLHDLKGLPHPFRLWAVRT